MIRGGEVGCAHSHQRVYQSIVENDIPFALVCEDDIMPFSPTNCIPNLKKLALLVDAHKHRNLVCHIGLTWYESISRQLIIDCRRFFPRLLPNIWAVKKSTSPVWLAHAYFVTQSAAKSMLNINHKIQFLADDWTAMQRYDAFDYFFVSKPILIPNTSFESNCQIQSDVSIDRPKPSLFLRAAKRICRSLSFFLPWDTLILS